MLAISAGIHIVRSIARKTVQPVCTSGRPMTNAIPIQLVPRPRPQIVLILLAAFQYINVSIPNPTSSHSAWSPSQTIDFLAPSLLLLTLSRGRPSLHTRARQVLAPAASILGLSLVAEVYKLCSQISTRTPLCVGTSDFALDIVEAG